MVKGRNEAMYSIIEEKHQKSALSKDKNSNKNTSADKALNKIRDAIVTGELRPNQRLVERQLSQQFGMSRTPIREPL